MKVTLATVPLYKVRAYNYVQPDKILTNGVAINWARTTDQIALYWFPAFEEVVISNWTIVDVNTPGNAYTNDHVPSTYENFALIATVAKEAAFSLTTSNCALANSLGIYGKYYLCSFLKTLAYFRIHHTSHNGILSGIGFVS